MSTYLGGKAIEVSDEIIRATDETVKKLRNNHQDISGCLKEMENNINYSLKTAVEGLEVTNITKLNEFVASIHGSLHKVVTQVEGSQNITSSHIDRIISEITTLHMNMNEMKNNLTGLSAEILDQRKEMKVIFDNIGSSVSNLHDKMQSIEASLARLASVADLKVFCKTLNDDLNASVMKQLDMALNSNSDVINDLLNVHYNKITQDYTALSNIVKFNLKDKDLESTKIIITNALKDMNQNMLMLSEKMNAVNDLVLSINTHTKALPELYSKQDLMTATTDSLLDAVLCHLIPDVNALSSNTTNSVFHEEFASLVENALHKSESNQSLNNGEKQALLEAMNDIRNRVDTIRTTQVDTLFRANEFPLFPVMALEKNVLTDMFCSTYRVNFLCSVCGRKGRGGKKGKGYELRVFKKWTKNALMLATVTLQVAEVACRVYGLPVPSVSNLISNSPDVLSQLQLCSDLIDKNATLGKIAVRGIADRPKITLAHVKMMSILFTLLKDDNHLYTGLESVAHADGRCTWVCKGDLNQPSGCSLSFAAAGRDVLLFHPELEVYMDMYIVDYNL